MLSHSTCPSMPSTQPAPRFAPKRLCLPHPTEEVALHTLERLGSLLIRDAAAEHELSEIEAHADKYRQRRIRLQEKIFRCKAVLAPVRRIPLEVLAHIFGFLISSFPDAIVSVSLVCRAWRDASRFPELWTNIVITAENVREETKMQAYLERSSRLPLQITHSQSLGKGRQWKGWSILVSSIRRWRSLSLIFDDSKEASSRIRALGPTPRLTELSVTILGQSSSADGGVFGFEVYDHTSKKTNLPVLRSLTLRTFSLPRPGITFSMLTKLHIVDNFFELVNPSQALFPIQAGAILEILAHCHSLDSFLFDAEATSHHFALRSQAPPYQGPEIPLPRLRHLHLKCHHVIGDTIFKYLTADNLEIVEFSLFPRYEVQKDNMLGTAAAIFLIRALRLRSVTLYGLHYCVVLAGCIRSFRILEELHLRHVPGLDIFTERLSTQQRVTLYRDPFWYAPRLSTLILDANWDTLPWDNLYMAVKVRHAENLAHGTPARIQRLIINGRDMLEGAPPGEMVKYERPQRFCGLKKQCRP